MVAVRRWLSPLSAAALSVLAVAAGAPARATPAIAAESSPPAAAATASIAIADRPDPAPVALRPGGLCAAQAFAEIDRVVESPTFASGRWGIRVTDADTRQVLYDRNGNVPFIPASNNKLFITASALQQYAPNAPARNSTLGEWVNIINRNSNNGYADTLFRALGSYANVRQTLTPLGVDPNSYYMADGSGLSRNNRTTPTALTSLLQAMRSANGSDTFRRSLPVAGTSGTLKRRLRGTSVQGKLAAKTGTLRGVRALSGYLPHADYGTLAFSILVNQAGQSGNTMLGAIDRVVVLIDRMSPCQTEAPDAEPTVAATH